jgi:rubrerythrin
MEKRTFEPLEAAIKFEEDGRAFFSAAHKKTEAKFGKSIFFSLADAELDHIQRIRMIYDSLSEMGEWPDAPSKGYRGLFMMIRFTGFLLRRGPTGTGHEKALV